LKDLAKQDPRLIYRPILSEEKATTIPYGFISDYIEQDFGSLKNFRAYLCGNPEMIASFKQVLLAKDLDPNRLHYDG